MDESAARTDTIFQDIGGQKTIDFHYVKSSHHRAIHADGFWGGSTPRGDICVSFFNERPPIPKLARREVTSLDGSRFEAGPEQAVETLQGIVRTIEDSVFMDLTTAREFLVWLDTAVANLEQAVGVPESERIGGRRA